MTSEIDFYSGMAIVIMGVLGLFWPIMLLVAWIGTIAWALVFTY